MTPVRGERFLVPQLSDPNALGQKELKKIILDLEHDLNHFDFRTYHMQFVCPI